MDCITVKPGVECSFMSKKGCSFNGGSCHQIIESCTGCARVLTNDLGSFCASFPDPTIKWKRGACNFATHVKAAAAVEQKVNPLKASKRARGK